MLKALEGLREVWMRHLIDQTLKEYSSRSSDSVTEASGSTTEDASPESSGRNGGLLDHAMARASAGASLTRKQVALILGVSTKTVQRMDAMRQLRRCPNLPGVVRYPASDVLRLASAKRKES